ncbi:MAG: hypothetical protein PWQ59_1514, partial [Thermoanaerobacterium sp.]|nr:hypothetical protein [Thermoanaerobacterium sp.]
EYSFNLIHTGDIVKGKIIKILSDGIIADINYKADAYVPKDQLSIDPNLDINSFFKVGDEIDLYIVKREDENGDVLASKVKADTELAEEKLDTVYKNGDILSGKIIEVIKGGVLADILGVKAFIPASQLDIHYVNDLNDYLGKNVKVKIIDYIPNKKLIVSQKVVLEEEKLKEKEELLKTLQEGQVIQGVVKSIAKFGAFIDIGGIDGLIPLSEISWGRNKNINDILNIGEKVDVYVEKIDKEKIKLSLRKLIPDPCTTISIKIKVGDVILGKIVNITTFGIFVDISDGVEGLVHKSDLLKNIKEYRIGENISVEILNIDVNNKRMSLREIDRSNESYELEREDLNVSIKDILQSIK